MNFSTRFKMKDLSALRFFIVVATVVHSSIASAESAAVADVPRFEAKLDKRGFIDVWQLRRDVTVVEALRVFDDTDYCFPEGDPDEEPPTAEQIEETKETGDECVAGIKRDYAAYSAIRDAFNRAWLPAIRTAVKRGDPVAEVVLRYCDTTDALDREGVESTCDQDPKRRDMAEARLSQIGFIPTNPTGRQLSRYRLPIYRQPNDESREYVQLEVLEKFSGGALSIDVNVWREIFNSGNTAKNRKQLAFYDRDALIEAIQREATRAFTWGRSGEDDPLVFGGLKLNRKPLTPGYLTWGPAKHYGGWNTIYTGPQYWRASPIKVYFSDGGKSEITLIAGKCYSPFEETLASHLTKIADNIDRYLKEDPRWAVFLLHRIGHHEWVPEGMQSATHRLNPSWEGDWVLEKESSNWSSPMYAASGHAKIERDGEYFRISIVSKNASEPLLDVKSCLLRYSGGLTYQSDGTAHNTLLGYFGSSGTGIAGRFGRDGENREAVMPFDPAKRYKQVLMQCENAESLSSPRVRFLLLAGDTLVEFGATTPFGTGLAVRHYRRAR